MCGIVGIIRDDSEKVAKEDVCGAADLLRKRGPDDSGAWIQDNVGLGHRRLSILDLTKAGHQPMISDNGRYIIVHNGEVYNFLEIRQKLDGFIGKWKSNSDTEVILAAYSKWGVDCVKHFHGMFAFAIWDRHEEILFAARDRMGVKPFYYHCSNDCFAFASRPRALFPLKKNLSKEIDEQALRLYLDCGYIPAPYSIYNDVSKLPPAHYLLVHKNELKIERYWDFRQISPEPSWKDRKEDDLLDELDEIISRSINSRMVSDVPLGAFLSGGIDSSLVVAIMAKQSSLPVSTFTIGFNEKDYDESDYAKSVADHLGTEHHCEHMKVNELLQLMPEFVQEYDEPFFDHSAFPVMAVSRLARRSVTVSLSGDGGDELFGGYHYYQIAEKLSTLFRLPRTLRGLLSYLLRLLPAHNFKLLAGALDQPDETSSFAFSRSIIKDFETLVSPFITKNTKSIKDLFKGAAGVFPSGLCSSEKGMRFDAFYTLPDDYLQKVDVASMAYSLESRVPLLDHDVVEWAMKLPVSWKLKNGNNKYLLRKLAYRYVPEKILDRPKQGFGLPVNDWLRKDLKSWAEKRLFDNKLFQNLPLNHSSVLALWELHKSTTRNVHPLLWAVLVLLEFNANDHRL